MTPVINTTQWGGFPATDKVRNIAYLAVGHLYDCRLNVRWNIAVTN
jgi:hypothetical protein